MLSLPWTDSNSAEHSIIETLYQNYKYIMYSTALRYLSNKSVCEDVVQDAVVCLMRHEDILREMSPAVVCKYITATVRNTAFNYNKHDQALQKKLFDVYYSDPKTYKESYLSDSPEEIFLNEEKTAVLLQLMEKLSEEERLLLEGRYFMQLSDTELADLVCCSALAVRMRLSRARKHLKQLMTAYYSK